MKKVFVLGVFALLGAMNVNAQCLVTEEIDTTYIKLDANQLPINYINLTKADLQEKVGELETIFENEEFGLYAAGDYTFKIEGDRVISQSINIADKSEEKIVYNQILNALSKSNSLKDSHNTGGNLYEYADFQIVFDDFDGYEKLTFQAIPQEVASEYDY